LKCLTLFVTTSQTGMISKITFKNYKSFAEKQELELKPITILIGKNSSGKSAVAKLPTLIEGALAGNTEEPFSFINDGVELGADYRDIFHKRQPNNVLEFELYAKLPNEQHKLEVHIIADYKENTIPKIIYWKFDKFELIYEDNTGQYFDKGRQQKISCDFQGFKLRIDPSMWIEAKSFGLDVNYVGPLRVFAQNIRDFRLPPKRNFNHVGNEGKNAYYILALESLNNGSALLKSINDWFEKHFEGWGIRVENDNPPYEIHLYKEQPEYFSVNIADVGQGMSQALPLVVSAFLPNKSTLTVIEQPELHLHPGIHGDLAQLFAETAIQLNKKYLIETHSRNFVLRLRRMVAEKRLKKDDLAIYEVYYDQEKNTSSLKRIHVDDLGRVDYWPEGIFSEALDETIAIRTAQINAERNAN